MKIKNMMMAFSGLVLLAAGTAFGEDTFQINIVRVQQRCPWSTLVDIDFNLAGSSYAKDGATNHFVRLTCTGDFVENDSSGGVVTNKKSVVLRSFVEYANLLALPINNNGTVPTGNKRVVWCPEMDGVSGRILNATITGEVVARTEVKNTIEESPYPHYIVYDLTTGTKSVLWKHPTASNCEPLDKYSGNYDTSTASQYLSAGNMSNYGGSDRPFKMDKLVLRKIHCGDFKMLKSGEQTLGGPAVFTGCRQIKLTRDYYISIFPLTQQQYWRIMGGSEETKPVTTDAMKPYVGATYSGVRGSSPTGEVGAGTLIDKLRTLTGNNTFDLPTFAQYQYAAMGGLFRPISFCPVSLSNATVFPTLGVVGDKLTVQGNVGKNTTYYYSVAGAEVGHAWPNSWFIYNTMGCILTLARDVLPASAKNWSLYDWSSYGSVDPMVTPGEGTGYVIGMGVHPEHVMIDGEDFVTRAASCMVECNANGPFIDVNGNVTGTDTDMATMASAYMGVRLICTLPAEVEAPAAEQ